VSEAAKDEYFDLFVVPKTGGIVWSYANRGITVKADRVAFEIDGIAHEGRFSDIREIRMSVTTVLAKGSSGTGGVCQMTFADGFVVSAVSNDGRGFPDPERIAPYVNFVSELHHRLSAADKSRIRFFAGLTEGRHMVLMVAAGFFALMSLIPLFVFFYTGEWKILLTLIACVAFVWPIWKSAEANRPRPYNPDSLPEDLIPES
jgi:hypothetical protein